MSIYFGDDINRVYYGGEEISSVYYGSELIWVNYREETLRLTTPGWYTPAVPSWCREIDFVLLGGGGGGDRGNSANSTAGDGGREGQWHFASVPFTYGGIKIYVANGGSGTTGTNFDNTDGEGTRIWGPNDEYVGWGQGGAKGSGTAGAPTGGSPGSQSHAGLSISGGSGGAMNTDGGSPGGGGGGGNGGIFGIFSVGRPGGRGEAIIRFRSGPMQ